jgi:hypothetical protein
MLNQLMFEAAAHTATAARRHRRYEPRASSLMATRRTAQRRPHRWGGAPR